MVIRLVVAAICIIVALLMVTLLSAVIYLDESHAIKTVYGEVVDNDDDKR